MTITKEDVLDNLEQVKSLIEDNENKKKEKKIGIQIKNRFTGEIIFESTKTTLKEAVEEANLCEAELMSAKFYGKSVTQKLTKEQVPDFLKALGFIIEE